MDKEVTRWYSPRLEQEMPLVRWGHYGTPVLLFPTAGGDAEEIERFHLVGALGALIDAGRIKVYSTDSVAGRVWFSGQHSPEFCALFQNRFDDFDRNKPLIFVGEYAAHDTDRKNTLYSALSEAAFLNGGRDCLIERCNDDRALVWLLCQPRHRRSPTAEIGTLQRVIRLLA